MPLSKKRKNKKTGKPVSRNLGDMESGVTFQDLINTLAYQEYVKDGTIVPEQPGPDILEIDFEDPDTAAIITAVHDSNIDNKEQD